MNRVVLATSLVVGCAVAELRYYVDCTSGSDGPGPGTSTAPFRSPVHARDAIRAARALLPTARATVFVAGLCELDAPLALGAQDSNAAWRAWPGGAAAILSGGTAIPAPPSNNNSSSSSSSSSSSAAAVVVVDLGKLGFDRASLGVLKGRGYSGGSACIRLDAFEPSAAELSFRPAGAVAGRADGAPADAQMDLARFPNRVPGPSASTANWERVGALGASKSSFALSAPAKARAEQWGAEIKAGGWPLFAHGLWDWNWADAHRPVLGADGAAGVLTVGDDDQGDRDAPLKAGGHFYVYNALTELDAAGEYHIDPTNLTLRFLPPPAASPAPPAPPPGATCAWSVEVSRSDKPGAIFEVLNVSGTVDDHFAFGGSCSATWGPMGARCAASLGVKAGAYLMTNRAGTAVGEGVCCNGVKDAVVKATRGACSGGAPTPAPTPAPPPSLLGTYHLSRLMSVLMIEGASDVTLEGLEVRHARGAAVVVRDCARTALRGCTVADAGMMGVNVTGGTNCSIADSDVALNGDGGVVLDGGDRATLAPAGHVASNCTLHRNSRWIMNYAPSAFLGGVGNTISSCKVYDAPQIGVFMQGNDHTLVDSEVFDVARQCSDCGAFYGGREWTYRGNRIVGNHWHDIGSIFGGGTQSIYLDDMLSGFDIEGNRFDHGSGDHVLELGGGRNVRFVGNLLNGSGEVAFDNRGMGWDKNGCKAGGDPFDFLARVPFSDPMGPYAKYANMTNIVSDDPCRPKYNELSNNVLCGSAKAVTSTSAATIASWGSSATNNTYTAVCPEA